jgi:uncharacterized glyoxalase superfamily protein PhnB
MAIPFERVSPVLPVRDVAAALATYRALGFEVDAYDEPGVSTPEDPIYAFLRWGPVELHLSRYRELDPKSNTSACYLYVDDADALYAQWSAAQVEGRLRPPEDTPYGLRELEYVDPDGNALRVGSPIRPK